MVVCRGPILNAEEENFLVWDVRILMFFFGTHEHLKIFYILYQVLSIVLGVTDISRRIFMYLHESRRLRLDVFLPPRRFLEKAKKTLS